MAGDRPARGGVLETMADFYERRRREVANLGREAEVAAHKAYGEAIRSGRDLILRTQGDVNRFGASLVGDQKKPQPRSGPAAQQARGAGVDRGRAVRPPAPRAKVDLDQSLVAKAVAGDLAQRVGNTAGVVRGGIHTLEGLVHGANFLRRLTDPTDALFSPPGQSATAQLFGAASRAADYVREGVADPHSVIRDVQDKGRQMRVDLDPSASPVAPTVSEEVRRRLNVGMNQGELAFDVGSLAVGGPLAKGMKGLGRVSNVGNVGKYTAQGFSPRIAALLAEPYPSRAMGSHFVPRSYKLPKLLGGGPLPRKYSDGVFNRLAPDGISRGDMYELHYEVDPQFHVARLPRRLGGGVWHGDKLGLDKYGPVGRLWHGAPAPLKARVGGLGVAGAGAVHDLEAEDATW